MSTLAAFTIFGCVDIVRVSLAWDLSCSLSIFGIRALKISFILTLLATKDLGNCFRSLADCCRIQIRRVRECITRRVSVQKTRLWQVRRLLIWLFRSGCAKWRFFGQSHRELFILDRTEYSLVFLFNLS